MKRFILFIFALIPLVLPMAGCRQAGSDPNEKISVVCTVFPQYDWVRQILGGRAGDMKLTQLLNGRVDLHNYQPSVDDIVKISACDLFIYVGGESDKWVGEALKSATNPNMIVINLLDALGNKAKIEETLEGMEEEDADDEENYDEHVWLSLKNAIFFCSVIADALSSLDAENAGKYKGNLDAYAGRLAALDAEYQAFADSSPVRTLLFGDRFPFRYLTDDYGLKCYAVFSGCSAETEAGFDTVIRLASKADELGLKTIIVTESSDQSIAKAIKNNTVGKNQQILVLDAMQSVTLSDIQNGATYLTVMESNLNILKEALK